MLPRVASRVHTLALRVQHTSKNFASDAVEIDVRHVKEIRYRLAQAASHAYPTIIGLTVICHDNTSFVELTRDGSIITNLEGVV
jgi:hypothetical protein